MNNNFLYDLYDVIEKRKDNPVEGSYTCYLFEKGVDKMLKKCGEECGETIIAAKNMNNQELTSELSDLFYQLMVLTVNQSVNIDDLADRCFDKAKKIGELTKKSECFMNDLYKAVSYRISNPIENSYTCYLYDEGLDKILKKCAESSSLVLIAVKNNDNEDFANELSEFFYHLVVLCVKQGLALEEIDKECDSRTKKERTLKKFKQVDIDT